MLPENEKDIFEAQKLSYARVYLMLVSTILVVFQINQFFRVEDRLNPLFQVVHWAISLILIVMFIYSHKT